MNNNTIRRNIVIYIISVLLLATVGGIAATVSEAGMLIFIISPLLMLELLRVAGRDGWNDTGLGLKLKEGWR